MAQIVKAGRSENSITHTVRKSFFHTAMRRALASTQLIFSSGTWSCFLIDNALVVQVWTHCHLVLEHTEKCTPLFVIKGNLQYFLFFIKKTPWRFRQCEGIYPHILKLCPGYDAPAFPTPRLIMKQVWGGGKVHTRFWWGTGKMTTWKTQAVMER